MTYPTPDKRHHPWKLSLSATLVTLMLAACGGGGGGGSSDSSNADPEATASEDGPRATSSGPIKVARNGQTVWSVNPGNNSVSAISTAGGKYQKIVEVSVGKEPRNLSLSKDGRRVYVSNSGGNTVSVIDASDIGKAHVVATIGVGVEPYGLVQSPNGKRLFVANARSNTVSVIDPQSYQVLQTIEGIGEEPRGLAVTNDGDADDDDEKLYVTQFFGVDRKGVFDGSIPIGADDYKEGRVAVVHTGTYQLLKQAVLNPMGDTGFKSNGSALKKIPPKFKTGPDGNPELDAAGKPVPLFEVATGAFPNMMQSVVIKGSRAYLPNTCASPDAPVRFNVNVQSCLSVLDTRTDTEGQVNGVPQTINMNRGINFEVGDPKDERKRLFLAVPWAIAFKRQANEGYAVSLSSNVVVKVQLDANGTPTINAPTKAGEVGNIVRILVGQGPRGIAVSPDDKFAYVANENSRDISVIDLSQDKVVATVRSADLPAPGTEAAKIQIGKALAETSTGIDLPQLSTPELSGTVQRFPARMSNEGWGSCFACHGFAHTDGVVWMFAGGPRRSLPLSASFNPHDANDLKVLNYTAQNDEFQDFDNNIKGVSGGLGLIVDADGKPGVTIPPLTTKNSGRSPQLDALAFYFAKGVRPPLSPLASEPAGSPKGQQIAHGRALFEQANCASCHGGPAWSSARVGLLGATPKVTLNPNPGGVQVLEDALRDVGTFFATNANEVRDNFNPATGLATPAAGSLGYVPPSLTSVFAFAPYLHNGSAQTLEDVMALKPHRTKGLLLGQPDPFESPENVRDIVSFLKSIDPTTQPFGIKPTTSPTQPPAAPY